MTDEKQPWGALRCTPAQARALDVIMPRKASAPYRRNRNNYQAHNPGRDTVDQYLTDTVYELSGGTGRLPEMLAQAAIAVRRRETRRGATYETVAERLRTAADALEDAARRARAVETIAGMRAEDDRADEALRAHVQELHRASCTEPVCRRCGRGPDEYEPGTGTHPHAGSDKARQETGQAGHCDTCARVGHVKAHRDLGCGDVGCNIHHDEEDEIR